MMSTRESSNLSTQLKKCLQKLQNLEHCCTSQVEFTNHFKDSLKCLSECLALVHIAAKQPDNQLYHSKLWLCVSQVVKVLTLFRSLLSGPPCRQTVWYLSERLQWCVSELNRVLSGGGTDQDQDDTGSSSFLHQVDQALRQLDSLDSGAWRLLLDDVVCQSVTVAKIASTIDYKEITSVCHRLLEESSQLMSCSDPCQLTLLKDSLAASLSSLEQRVNTAVLRLLLQVFSEPSGPVKRLVHCCSQAPHPCTAVDLDPLVTQLDTHIEHIIFIAQFAISCCKDKDEVAAMRCCLASIESVDNHLVPAVTAFYLAPDCADKRAFVKFLCNHWQHQLASLHSHLDGIINSYAFSLVVQDRMDMLSKKLSEDSEEVLEARQMIVKHGWLLYKHLSTSSDISIAPKILGKLKKALYKCEMAATNQVPSSAVTRQTKLVIDSVDLICDQLSVSTASQTAIDGSYTAIIERAHIGVADDPIETVKSIRDLPLDISVHSTSDSQFNSYRPQWLKNKICEAKENRKTHILNLTEIIRKNECEQGDEVVSNMRTPRRAGTVVQETSKSKDWLTPYLSYKAERNTTLYVRTPRKLLQSYHVDNSTTSADTDSLVDVKDSHSLALDITNILESLTILANTLSSEKEDNNWTTAGPTPPSGELNRYFSGESFNSHWFSQVPSDVNTPERLQDLAFLDEKLQQLKASVT